MTSRIPEPVPGISQEVCDYEGSNYRAAFWEGKGRDYEDAIERVALRKLLPPTGQRYVEFGAGFGRLINEAAAYEQVVLVDYSRTMLQDAQSRLGRSARYIYVAADLYHLPFAANVFDVALMCRVLHHLVDVPAVLRQIYATFTPGATFILEFANKQNLKAIGRYLLRRQSWSPFTHEPIEFVKLNFDFHPAYVRNALHQAGFLTEQQLAVSWLRLGSLKSILPLGGMVAVDKLLQPAGRVFPVAPSIFTENRVPGALTAVVPKDPIEAIFRCPTCGGMLRQADDLLICAGKGERWAIRDGIYDFKVPV